MEIGTVSTLVSLTLGLLGFLSGLVLWYKGAIEKRYAAERDFGHLKRNQEQMAQALGIIDEELTALIKGLDAVGEKSHEISQRLDQIDRTIIQHSIHWSYRNPQREHE